MTKKIDPKAPKRPKSVKSLVEFVNKKLPIDQRTVQARSIKAVKQAVEADPVVNLDLSGSLKRKRPRRARKLRKKKR